MDNKNIFGWLLKSPAILLVTSSVIAGWYVIFSGGKQVGIVTPIISTIILVAYIIGEYLLHKKQNSI